MARAAAGGLPFPAKVRCVRRARRGADGARACAGGAACGGGLLWDAETWGALVEAPNATGWFCAEECAAFRARAGHAVRACRVESSACAACARDEECADGACRCSFGFYERAGARCAPDAFALEFLVEARADGPGAMPPARAAADVGAPMLAALADAGVLRAGGGAHGARDAEVQRVFRAEFDGARAWVCTLTLASADVRLANLTDAARLERALWAASAGGSFVPGELGASSAGGSLFVRVRSLGPGAVREAPSYGFRVVSRAYSAPRWDMRLRLSRGADTSALAFVLLRVRGVDMGGCAGHAVASASAAPCCVGALARAYHTTAAFARAAGGCVRNASAADALARRDHLDGTLAGCERSHVRVRADGLVDVVLFQDELAATAISTTQRGAEQTSVFDIGIAVLRPAGAGAFSVRVVTQRLTLQFTAAYSFSGLLAAGRVFTPVVNATLQRFFLPAPVAAARDFVRIDVQRRRALADPATYEVVPASVRTGPVPASPCAAWDARARDAYAREVLRSVGVYPACPLYPAPADVCTGPAASLIVPLPAGAFDAGLAGPAARLELDFLVHVRTGPAASFLGRVALSLRVAWDAVHVPCPDLALLADAQPELSVGLFPAQAPSLAPGVFNSTMRVPAAATVLLAPPAGAFARPGTETHALAAEHLVLVFLTSRIAARTVDRLLARGRAWRAGTLEPTAELLRLCPLEGAAAGAPAFGCHVRFAVFHGVVATAADHAVELTATPTAARVTK